jgi:CRISPR-associated protein Cas5d
VQTDQDVEGNACHKLKEMLERRLLKGQCRFVACLGWKEFGPTYFGPLRNATKADPTVNEVVEGYLLGVWSRPHFGVWDPHFGTVTIIAGQCDIARNSRAS